jgi:hypothetical protein
MKALNLEIFYSYFLRLLIIYSRTGASVTYKTWIRIGYQIYSVRLQVTTN